jgi:hypothetical protein
MKKLITVFAICLSTLSSNVMSAHAETQQNFKNQVQVSDHFMLSLLSDEIRKSVANYYKEEKVSVGSPESIFIKYGHDDNKGLVEVFQSKKGHQLKNSFVVKVNVTPQKHGMLGRDTITFGVEPNNPKGNIEVKMLAYNPTDPKSK